MVLAQLEIRDLTRALSVSKYWQHIILSTIELRRNLFLAPKEKSDEALEWKQPRLEWEPFIVHESTSSSKSIVKAHPVLVPDLSLRTSLNIKQPHASLQMVSPSTLLTQPPVTEVIIEQHAFSIPCTDARTHKFVLKRPEGVTFGDVVEEMRVRQARESSSVRIAAEDPFVRNDENDKIPLGERYTRIEACGAIAEASKWVRIARERLAQERQSPELRRS
jgi:hypothetical protein